MAYDDPVTVPAADLAENPYWKRDVRRRYPQLSTVTQAQAVALLEVGSAAAPKQELIGDAGSKQLVAAQEDGQKGLSVAFERNTELAKDVLGPGGMPPLPTGLHPSAISSTRYKLEEDQSYGNEYVLSHLFSVLIQIADIIIAVVILAGRSHRRHLTNRYELEQPPL